MIEEEERLTRDQFARELLDLLNRSMPFLDMDDDDEDMPSGGIATSVLVVAEWESMDGPAGRWLSRMCLLGSGVNAPPWTAQMLAREALLP